MRTLLILASLCAAIGMSNGQAVESQSKAAPRGIPAKGLGTADHPLTVRIHPNETDRKEADRREAEIRQKAESDDNLVFWTRVLAVLAGLQVAALVIHAYMFSRQARAMQDSVDEMQLARRPTEAMARAAEQSTRSAEKSADAAIVSSMPILSPFIIGLDQLHPMVPIQQETITFRAYVPIVFENFGQTPAQIRALRADLFLCEMDEFPNVVFDELPKIGYEPIIPGAWRIPQAANMGVAECAREFTINKQAMKELLAEATERYRRFALIGQVLYDDFFGIRHTRNFCVKMRRVDSSRMFQLVRGGPPHNQITRQEIPVNTTSTANIAGQT